MASTTTILGNAAVTVPSDTTANRPGAVGGSYSAQTAVAGMMRFNQTTNYMEYYDGTAWQSITAPPTISSISPTYYSASGETITIAGSNLSQSPTVTMISKTGTSYTAATATYVNNSSVTFTIPSGMDSDNNDPFDVKITNISGLAYTLLGGLSRTTNPVFTNASGSIGTIYDSLRSAYSLTAVTATDAEGDVTLTYAVTSGALPTGLSLSSAGAITGTASAVGSDTTSTFTVTATGTDSSNSGNTVSASRSFSITVKAPVITSFTATGSNTFSVPTGISSVWVVALAGGGAGANGNGASGGGGAGGMIEMPAFPVTPGGSVPLSVGSGGTVGTPGSDVSGNPGTDTVFGSLTAKGGGGGGGWSSPAPLQRQTGGSAGGAGGPSSAVVPASQPSQPGNSGTYGYGNPGGSSTWPASTGGGGGGAGSAGANGNGAGTGIGGSGRASTITGSPVLYGGGGGGGLEYPIGVGAVGGPGGGGPAGNTPSNPGATPGVAGQTNRGAGGGAGTWGSGSVISGAVGGPGIVIVRY